ncbi:MAG: hypothetical protein WD045_13510 [Pirellulaceae bacterium]
MNTFPESIASTWDDVDNMSHWPLLDRDSIATESQQEEFPAWQKSIDALLRIWEEASSVGEGYDEAPAQNAIEAAIRWTAWLRKRFPSDPPTCIVPEPSGGIIVERRTKSVAGHDFIFELTFYNNGEAEWTEFIDGRVRRMEPMPSCPPDFR